MLLSKEELIKSAEIRPDVAEFVSKLPPSDFSDYKGVRDGLRAMTDAVIDLIGPAPPGTKEFFHEVPMRDGYMSSLKIHKSTDDIPGPLIVQCFGGGFIAGDNNQMTPTARAFVRLFGATVVNISYRLGPEYKFPQGPLDAIDSLKWIAENATGSILVADPAKGFLLGGASAGGCITASLSRRFQEDKLAHPLTGQWLNIPAVMDINSCPDEYKSYFIAPEQNENAPVLPKEAIDMMAKESGWDMSSDLRCAAVSKTPLSGQPRTYLQVAGMDPLRDDGLIYHEMLDRAGIPTKIDFYPGCPHGHAMVMAGTPLGNEGNIDSLVGVGWLLERPISREQAAETMGLRPN